MALDHRLVADVTLEKQRWPAGLVADVTLEKQRRPAGALALRVRELADVAIHDHEVGALAGEEPQAGETDPRCSAGDHRDPSVQTSGHCSVLPFATIC